MLHSRGCETKMYPHAWMISVNLPTCPEAYAAGEMGRHCTPLSNRGGINREIMRRMKNQTAETNASGKIGPNNIEA